MESEEDHGSNMESDGEDISIEDSEDDGDCDSGGDIDSDGSETEDSGDVIKVKVSKENRKKLAKPDVSSKKKS